VNEPRAHPSLPSTIGLGALIVTVVIPAFSGIGHLLARLFL